MNFHISVTISPTPAVVAASSIQWWPSVAHQQCPLAAANWARVTISGHGPARVIPPPHRTSGVY